MYSQTDSIIGIQSEFSERYGYAIDLYGSALILHLFDRFSCVPPVSLC